MCFMSKKGDIFGKTFQTAENILDVWSRIYLLLSNTFYISRYLKHIGGCIFQKQKIKTVFRIREWNWKLD